MTIEELIIDEQMPEHFRVHLKSGNAWWAYGMVWVNIPRNPLNKEASYNVSFRYDDNRKLVIRIHKL